MAEFILLNRAILNANGDFKLAIKNIDNIPGGNLPTPTRNLLNEFKNAVKEIEKQVVKADNQPNLANQANSGNIDSLTKQISYLQNAIKNSTKDAPTPSPIKQEADSLSEATQNLTQNSIKGNGFVTYPNSARQETAINQNLNIQEWVKNMSGVISDEWRANLTKLAKKHPEMFRSEADVFRVIKEIKDNPTHFFKNYDDDVALIGKQINDNKFANIGIVKNDGEIIHANKNKIKDLDRLQRRNKEMLTGTPLPATTRANNSMGGDLLQHFNDKTIPNQSIKEAETTAKEATQTEPNTNSRLEKIKKFVEGKTNKALDSEIKTYNELYRYVLDDFAKAHPDELNLPKYASEMANYITKEFLVKHDKEIKEIITQKTSGENRQIVLNAFENLKENFDELRSVGIGDLRKPTAKGIKDKIAEIEIKSMSDKELVTQFQKLKDSKARVNENLYKYLENEIKKERKSYIHL
ncbi:hypothetical protein [Campylobacter lanienae]|uniref:hypothetical protein n=1 Tax=Campylobacter lanienae TaxID=75658 RepID=UPI0011C90ABC|nr:hypothetical protein [Campylobacter lanienae]